MYEREEDLSEQRGKEREERAVHTMRDDKKDECVG